MYPLKTRSEDDQRSETINRSMDISIIESHQMVSSWSLSNLECSCRNAFMQYAPDVISRRCTR